MILRPLYFDLNTDWVLQEGLLSIKILVKNL